jgi:hypothetical protein
LKTLSSSSPNLVLSSLLYFFLAETIFSLLTSSFFHIMRREKIFHILATVGFLLRGEIPLGYGLDDRWFESQYGLEIFLFITASRLVLGPTQPPIQWVQLSLSLVVKRPGRDADHSPPTSAEVELYIPSPSMPPWHGAQLKKKHRDDFILITFTSRWPKYKVLV